MEPNKWWAYRHANDTWQFKRYFDPRDIQDARESVFVQYTVGPFSAETREDAIKFIKENHS